MRVVQVTWKRGLGSREEKKENGRLYGNKPKRRIRKKHEGPWRDLWRHLRFALYLLPPPFKERKKFKVFLFDPLHNTTTRNLFRSDRRGLSALLLDDCIIICQNRSWVDGNLSITFRCWSPSRSPTRLCISVVWRNDTQWGRNIRSDHLPSVLALLFIIWLFDRRRKNKQSKMFNMLCVCVCVYLATLSPAHPVRVIRAGLYFYIIW